MISSWEMNMVKVEQRLRFAFLNHPDRQRTRDIEEATRLDTDSSSSGGEKEENRFGRSFIFSISGAK